MSRRQFHSPVMPVLSPVKSEGDLNKTIISGLFSKQFLGCLKNELSSRAKDTKSNDQEYKQALEQARNFKKEVQTMRIKIQQLTLINQQLSNKLEEYESKTIAKDEFSRNPFINALSPKTTRHLEISKSINIKIIEEAPSPTTQEDEILYLKQRIEKLEVYKSIKDQRLNEMLEKQVRFESEIKFLKIKNDELEEEVKILREVITSIQESDNKPLKASVASDKHPDIAISYHFNFDSPYKQPQRQDSSLAPISQASLMASFTNNVEIPDDLTLSKACLKRESPSAKEFNEIDYIIGEELPYLKVSDELMLKRQSQPSPNPPPPSNLNSSIVVINLNNG